MSKGGGTQTSTTSIDPDVKNAYMGNLGYAQQVANQLGSMVGPILGGVVGTWLGIRPVFILTDLGFYSWGRVTHSNLKIR